MCCNGQVKMQILPQRRVATNPPQQHKRLRKILRSSYRKQVLQIIATKATE